GTSLHGLCISSCSLTCLSSSSDFLGDEQQCGSFQPSFSWQLKKALCGLAHLCKPGAA
ncbi:mCG1029838, partial [Mus musculus]